MALRSCAVASIAPSWRFFDSLKGSFSKLLALIPSQRMQISAEAARQIDALRQENQALWAEVQLLKQHLSLQTVVEEELKQLKKFDPADPFFKRRAEELLRLVDLQTAAVNARVIFREPVSWSSSLWIDVGEKQNQLLGKKVVAKNSPVVVGRAVVGIVEYVGKTRSKVRLITDSGLVPAVRVVRGGRQNALLIETAQMLLTQLEMRPDLFGDKEASGALTALKESFSREIDSLYLAKGELYGSSAPLWHARSLTLKGSGFNYDFEDNEGPARHLLTGEPHGGQGKKTALIRPGDLLATTGMDGIFPPGLAVAFVTEVKPLGDGACSFDIEAKAAAANLLEVSFVTVLPPVESLAGCSRATLFPQGRVGRALSIGAARSCRSFPRRRSSSTDLT